jgi:uncharacterized protein YndB with AHSA1/START domain
VTDTPTGHLAVEQRIRARPETVFAYFTDPAAYQRWMGENAELDARPGGLYRVRFEDGSVAEGRYEVVEPPRRVVFTWGWVASEELPPGSTRVEVVLVVEGDETVAGWRHYLERLGEASRSPEGDR